MFLPVNITLGAGEQKQAVYNRILDTSAKFDAVEAEAQDMRAPLTTIAEDLHTQIAAAFATEGSSGFTGRWRPLSPAYAAFKAKHGGGGLPILVGIRPVGPGRRGRRAFEKASGHKLGPRSYQTSGQMRRQLLVPLSDQSTWHITERRLLYAPLSDIAGYHETGTPKMPARPPVDVSPTFLHAIDRHFVTWLDALMVKAGLAGPGSG